MDGPCINVVFDGVKAHEEDWPYVVSEMRVVHLGSCMGSSKMWKKHKAEKYVGLRTSLRPTSLIAWEPKNATKG